ncbi:hypothetical protein F4775DRAFT_596264 [Biscogniauxia sp. FL1348]|nr:hypothetical protein F4775DRAFT_596264 [Biscogniauxia sp. FL1348]
MSGTTTPLGSATPAVATNSLMAPPPGGWIDPSEAPMHPRAVLLVGPVTAFYILGLAAIGLKIWARHIKKLSWRLSDYAVFIAAVFGTGYIALCWLVADRGALGYPITEVAPAERLLIRKAFFVGWLLQSWASSFVRLSILDLILHVFAVTKFRCAVYFFEAATGAWFGRGRALRQSHSNFFSAQIKMVLALLLIEYEFKFPEGQTARPKNWVRDEKTGPDMEQVILIRRREGLT